MSQTSTISRPSRVHNLFCTGPNMRLSSCYHYSEANTCAKLDELAGRLGTRRGTGPTLEDERLGQEKLPDLNLTDFVRLNLTDWNLSDSFSPNLASYLNLPRGILCDQFLRAPLSKYMQTNIAEMLRNNSFTNAHKCYKCSTTVSTKFLGVLYQTSRPILPDELCHGIS